MIQVIALDLDGTVLRSDKTVSEKTIKMLQECKSRGMKIVFATGRAPRSIVRLLPEEFHKDAWICYNGVEIYDGGEKIRVNYLSATCAHEVVELLEKQFPERAVTAEINGQIYSNKYIDDKANYSIVNLKEAISLPVTKLLIKVDKTKDLAIINRGLPAGCKMITVDISDLAMLISDSASKTLALRQLLAKYNYTLDNVLAFGDDLNDIEMLRESKLGVAMGNASDEVKKYADYVTRSNDKDGIAEFLENFLGDGSQKLRG